jgi:hypothetical protein
MLGVIAMPYLLVHSACVPELSTRRVLMRHHQHYVRNTHVSLIQLSNYLFAETNYIFLNI